MSINLPGNANRPKVTQVATGRKKRKSFGGQLRETLIEDTAQSVGSYVVFDVILPEIKNLISDIINQSTDRFLFGGSGRSRPTRSVGRSGYTNYSKQPSTPYSGRTVAQREKPQRRHDFDSIILPSREEAQEVLDKLNDFIDEYELATVSDLYDLVGVTSTFVDNQWGWYNLVGASIRRIRDGFTLDLPRPSEVK